MDKMDWKHDTPPYQSSVAPAQYQASNTATQFPYKPLQRHQHLRRKLPIPHHKLDPSALSRTLKSKATLAAETIAAAGPSAALIASLSVSQPRRAHKATSGKSLLHLSPRRPGAPTALSESFLPISAAEISLKRKRKQEDEGRVERERVRGLFHRGIPGEWREWEDRTNVGNLTAQEYQDWCATATSHQSFPWGERIYRAAEVEQLERAAAQEAADAIVNATVATYQAASRGPERLLRYGRRVSNKLTAASRRVFLAARYGVRRLGSAKRSCVQSVSGVFRPSQLPTLHRPHHQLFERSIARSILRIQTPLRPHESHHHPTFFPRITRPARPVTAQQGRSIQEPQISETRLERRRLATLPLDSGRTLINWDNLEENPFPQIPEADSEDDTPSPAKLSEAPATSTSSPGQAKESLAASVGPSAPAPPTPSRQLLHELSAAADAEHTPRSEHTPHTPSRQLQAELSATMEPVGWFRTSYNSLALMLNYLQSPAPEPELPADTTGLAHEVARKRAREALRGQRTAHPSATNVESSKSGQKPAEESSEDELAGPAPGALPAREDSPIRSLGESLRASTVNDTSDQALPELGNDDYLFLSAKPNKHRLSARASVGLSPVTLSKETPKVAEPVLSTTRVSKRIQAHRDKVEEEQRKIREEADRKAAQAAKAAVLVSPTRKAIGSLDRKWARELRTAMSKPLDAELAHDLKGIPLTRRSFGTCLPEQGRDSMSAWLNDEIITSYLDHVCAYGNGQTAGNPRPEQQPKDVPRYAAFNNAWWTTVTQKGVQGVARWSKRLGLEGERLLQAEMVLIPINSGVHWTIAVMRPKMKRVEFYDSMGSTPGNVFDRISAFLAMQLKDAYVKSEWTFTMPNCPKQTNTSDCGVFAITAAKMLMLGLDPLKTYDDSDMATQRQRILAELLNGGFSGDFEPEDPLAASYYN